MSLGKRLKKERKLRNWSQKYVADKIGISNSVLSNYERDYRDPDTETLARLTELYDVSADYILGRKPHRETSTDCQTNLTEEEQDILNELKKYPDLFYDLLANPEKKVKDIVQSQKIKHLLKKELLENGNSNE